MTSPNTVYFPDRTKWREWLERNFDKEREIWLVYPKKSSGKPRILYNDAVEEALCFAWIDSTMKTLDAENNIQRFTRRRPNSPYSQPNKERLKWLYRHDMIHPSVQQSILDILNEEFEFPPDIIKAIKKDPVAWINYNAFSDSYKRIRIAYIEGARKRPEEFKKRLKNFIKKTRENKKFGFGGIEKYY